MSRDEIEFGDHFPEIEDVELTEFQLEVLDAVSKAYSIRAEITGEVGLVRGEIDITTELIAICMKSICRLPTATQRREIDNAMDVLMTKRCPIQVISEEEVSVLDGVCVACDVFEAVPQKTKIKSKYRIYTVYEKPIPCLTEEERSMLIEGYRGEEMDDDYDEDDEDYEDDDE